MRQIVKNAGGEGSVVVGKVLSKEDYAWGYDAQSDQYCNLVDAGIVDPAKVVRSALQDAASIAGLIITTEASIVAKPKTSGSPSAPAYDDMDF